MDNSLKELQIQWYEKLKSEGFEEIENTTSPNRPLIEWHSFKMTSEKTQLIKNARAQYQTQIENFINSPSFDDASEFLIKHKNCKFSKPQIKLIWELHIEGFTTREIAKRLDRWKSRTDDVIRKLKSWMLLV